MDAVETTLTEIKQEARGIRRDARGRLKILISTVTAGGLGLAWMMAKGFGWV